MAIAPIIPMVAVVLFAEYKMAEPMNTADDNMLPANKVFCFGLLISCNDLFSSRNFFSSGAMEMVASKD